MNYSMLLLIFLSHLADGQNHNERCKSIDAEDSAIPKQCDLFYSRLEILNVTYYEEDIIPNLKSALIDSYTVLPHTSSNFDQCLEIIVIYLCNYYFPICRTDRIEIVPVCSSSCNLLFNNEECLNLFKDALSFIAGNNITVLPDNNSCAMTYRPFGSNQLEEWEFCFNLEDYLTEPFPLSCKELPQEQFCSSQLTDHVHYAPGTLWTSADPNDLNDEIRQINELIEFALCGELLNKLNCIVRYPSCSNETEKLIPICESQCLQIDVQIKQCLILLEDNFPRLNFPLVNSLLSSIECDEPETYYYFPLKHIETNSTNCLMLTFESPANTTANPAESDSSEDIGTIIGSVITVIIVVAFVTTIITIIYLVRKKSTLIDEIRTLESQKSEASLRYVSNPRDQSISHSSIDTEASLLEYHRASIHLQTYQLMLYVKERFSDVLLSAENITKLELLGKGKFGVVYKGKLASDDDNFEVVAIKTIKSDSLDGIKDLIAESSIMKTFHHPNVLPLLGVCIDYDTEDVLKLVIPFMSNGDLRNFLKDSRVSPNNTHEYPENLSEKIIKRMCLDIAKGMEYLAERRFIHRDLAARNCMVDDRLSIKVADFGLAKDVYSTEYYRVEKHTTLPVKWMAMESLIDGYFDERTDVWSYGVTCWEIFSLGKIPYPGVDNADVINYLKSGKRLEQPYLCPQDFYEMIQGTWQGDPMNRPLFNDIIQFLRNQNIEVSDTQAGITVVDTNSPYLDVFHVATCT